MVEILDFELRRGSGIPFAMIESGTIIPSTKLERVLLDHIFNNYSYDPQCEGSRHEYLYEVVSAYSRRENIYSQVLQHFEEITGSDYGEYQVFGFVSRMVKDGFCAMTIFVEKFESYWESVSSPFSIGVEEILNLEHTEGIRRIARLFGKRISKGLEVEYLGTPFFGEYSEKSGFDISKTLELLRSDPDPMISAYINAIEVEPTADKPNREFDFDEAFGRVLAGKKFPVGRIVRKATEDQFRRYCDEFTNLKDLSIKSQMVYGFSVRKFLGSIDLLIAEYCRSRNIDYRHSLLEAMIPFYDEKARKLVEELYEEKSRMIRTKVLLTQMKESDVWWILESFEIFSGHELHSEIGFILGDERIASSSVFGGILEILLRRIQCSICRNSVVERMITSNLLDRNQVLVLMKDCHPGTRKVAEAYFSKLT